MKPNIKFTFLSAALLLTISCSTENDSKCPKEGKVIGYDLRDCVCCGGWFVEYNNDTLLFDAVPNNSKLEEIARAYGFPIEINFEMADSTHCIGMISTMTCIEITGHNTCNYSGEIIGYDYTECLCCPGWIIKTETDTFKVALLPLEQEVRKRVDRNGFPVLIKLSYENIQGNCDSVYKLITCMEIKD